jgi:hypothetical protein
LDVDIKIISTTASVLAKEALLVCFIDSTLQLDLLIPELAAHINVSGLCSHTETDNQSTLNELVGVMSQDLSIFACSWLRLITIDNKIGRTAV